MPQSLPDSTEVDEEIAFQTIAIKLQLRIMEKVSFEKLILLQQTSCWAYDLAQNLSNRTELEVCVVSVNGDSFAIESSEQEISSEELAKFPVWINTKLLILFTTIDDRQCEIMCSLFERNVINVDQFEIRGSIECEPGLLQKMIQTSGTTDVLVMSPLPASHISSLAIPQIEKIYFDHHVDGSDDDFLKIRASTVLVPSGSLSQEGIKQLFKEWKEGQRNITLFRWDFSRVHLARRMFRDLRPEIVWAPRMHNRSCIKQIPMEFLRPFVVMNMEFYRWTNVRGEVLMGYLHRNYIELSHGDAKEFLMKKLSPDNYIRATNRCRECEEADSCVHIKRMEKLGPGSPLVKTNRRRR